jgi:hypothetical protein
MYFRLVILVTTGDLCFSVAAIKSKGAVEGHI